MGWPRSADGDRPLSTSGVTRNAAAAHRGVLAVAALWLLARIRFPERPVTPNPVPSVLSQLASGPKYDDLAGEIAQLQARLEPSLLALDVPSPALGSSQTSPRMAAIRLRDDLAVTWLPAGSNRERGTTRTSSPAIRLPAWRWCAYRAGDPLLLPCPGRHAGCSSRATSSPATCHRRACRCARCSSDRSIRSRARCGPSRSGRCRRAAIWRRDRSCSPAARNSWVW